uniref:Uncharacterized protein n=1 Tax=Meloidogyne incognita TaxID=6306 RepID=A0A914N9M4_MELIC
MIFYEVSPNNFYNLESEQQQFPCPPYGMCDFGVENNNQNLETLLIQNHFCFAPHLNNN